MKNVSSKFSFRALNDSERKYLCSLIETYAGIARRADHPMREISKKLMSYVLWRWTADAVKCGATGITKDVVKQDKWKYNCEVHPFTEKAKLITKDKGKRLRHEHVVPRDLIIRHILEEELEKETLFNFLCIFCKCAIVTKEEDQQLRPRNTMPNGWAWDEACVYSRYENSKMKLMFPNDQP